MPCCSSCAEGHPAGCADWVGANRVDPRARGRQLAPSKPFLVRNGQALGFIGPLLSMVSAVNTVRSLGAPGCGAEYMNLVQAAGERSKASPYGIPGLWCNVEDATAWHQTVLTVRGLVVEAGRSLDPANVPPELAAWLSTVDQLPEPSNWMAFGFGDCGEVVAAYIAAIEKGACMLELLKGAGATPLVPSVGPPPKSLPGQLGGGIASLAVGAGLLFLGYLALTSKRSQTRQD